METIVLPESGVLGITNEKDSAVMIRIQPACGAVIECTLTAGSRMQITRGRSHIDLNLLDGDPASLSVVNLGDQA